MDQWLLLSAWMAAHFFQLTFGIVALRQRIDPQRPTRHVSLLISGLSSFLPFIALALFLRVFVIGGSSNVAQLAGDEGLDLWHLWFSAWPFLLFGIPVAGIASLVAVLMPPYTLRTWPSIASRALTVLAVALSFFHVAKYFPDA
jgi:hypothetical protein